MERYIQCSFTQLCVLYFECLWHWLFILVECSAGLLVMCSLTNKLKAIRNDCCTWAHFVRCDGWNGEKTTGGLQWEKLWMHLNKRQSIKSYQNASGDRHFLGCTTALHNTVRYNITFNFTVARFKCIFYLSTLSILHLGTFTLSKRINVYAYKVLTCFLNFK